MYRLSFTVMFLLGLFFSTAQSPHGENFKVACEQCHNPSGWGIDFNSLRFNHDKTDFTLEGSHELVDCKMCHEDLTFKGAPMECASCHTDVHSQSVGNDCARCHDSETWLVSNIPELHEANGFPLIGTHNNLSCVECHTSETTLRFDRVGNDCISCHQDDYASTQNPNHQTAGFSIDCIECHNPLGFGWDSESINHDFFPLTQGHDIQDCTQCHTTGNYADASPECVSCHQEDYAGTQDPNHQSSGFSTDCVNCHTTNPGWRPANINHDFFPLTQGHDLQDCTQCHTNGTYAGTQDPNHQTSGFSTDCASCHSTNPGWTPATINHDFFPLTQGHDIQDCTQCHTNGTYAGLSPDCISCHQDDYAGTQDPNHQTSGFSTDCASCHTTNPGWSPATIDHDFFPLTQGHNIQDCTQCHTNGTYAGLSSECSTCHQNDYDQASNPNHSAAGFPTDCVQCHTTSPDWNPTSFDHNNYFPIYTGKHRQGETWDTCIECHINPNNFGTFDCIHCHTNDHNTNLGNQRCYECHPNGSS